MYTRTFIILDWETVLKKKHLPVLSLMIELSLGLKRASVLLRMNSTTTDWIRTSMNAAVPLKQADSICLDLKHSKAQRNPFHSSVPLRHAPVHRHRKARMKQQS